MEGGCERGFNFLIAGMAVLWSICWVIGTESRVWNGEAPHHLTSEDLNETA